MEEDAILILFDLCGDFEEGQDDRRGLGLGECGLVSGGGPQGMVADVGRTREQQPERIRQESGRRGAITAQVYFHCLDIIFAIAPGAREFLIQHRRSGGVQRRHDKAGVIAGTHDFGLEHHAPWLGPGSRRIGELVIESATGGRRLAMGLSQRHPLVMELPGCLDGGSSLAEQDGIAGEAKDAIRPAVGGDDVDDLGGGTMPIAADEEVGLGPVAPQIGQQPDQEHGIFGSRRARARTQGGCDQRMRRPFKNEER